MNFKAFPTTFKIAWLMRRVSPMTRSCSMLPTLTSNCSFLALACGRMIATRSRTSSGRTNSSSFKAILPLSILLMSSTSLIKPSKCLDEAEILPRQSLIFKGSSRCIPAIVVMPMMAFIGVRISWDILNKNRDFAAFALWAEVSASRSARSIASS